MPTGNRLMFVSTIGFCFLFPFALFADVQLIFCKDNANERRISSLLEYYAECSLSSAKIQKISINAIVMNEKVLILLNTTILTENTELGDEGGCR